MSVIRCPLDEPKSKMYPRALKNILINVSKESNGRKFSVVKNKFWSKLKFDETNGCTKFVEPE